MVDFRTVTIARDIAEEEAATAYDALSEEILELRHEIGMLRRLINEERAWHGARYLRMLEELRKLRDALS